MKNNYKKLIATVLLAWMSVSAQALLYKNEYYLWTYYNTTDVAPFNASMKPLSRTTSVIPTFWNSGEPNNSSGNEHCATQAQNAGWNDANCNAANHLACFNGTSWALSTGTVNLNGYNSTALPPGCPSGYQFAAPINSAQTAALKAVIPSGAIAWINAFDNSKGMGKEGVWVINRGVTGLFGANWAAGEPANDPAKKCTAIDNTGKWSARDCAASLPVLCAAQGSSSFSLSAATAYSSSEAANQACRNSGSMRHEARAPISVAENTAAGNALAAASVSAAWINARSEIIDNANGRGTVVNLDLTNWQAGAPDANGEKCVVARASDGTWRQVSCNARAQLLCSDGESWVVRNAVHQFSNQALDACSRPNGAADTTNPFAKYRLATPITEYDRLKADTAIRGGSGDYWLNLKYLPDTNTWLRNDGYQKPEFKGATPQKAVWYHVMEDGKNDKLHSGNWTEYETGNTITNANKDLVLAKNRGVTVYFADKEPNGSESSNRASCIQMYGSTGNWDDTPCTNVKRFACFDGYEWAISPAASDQGENVDASEDVSSGHNACAAITKNGVAGNFVFAAPRSFKQSMQLKNVINVAGAGDVWINMNSKKYKRAYVMNLGANVLAPFWNAGEPNNAGAGEDCAVQEKAAGRKWNDLPCSSTQRLACYDPFDGANGKWQITANAYVYTNPVALSRQCEIEFGSRYKFYAPETLSQMNALKTAMPAGVDVYINADDQQYEGSWQMNREVNNWAATEQASLAANNGKNCVAANATDSQWRTKDCNTNLPVACYTGGAWYFTKTHKANLSNFASGQEACLAEFGSGYLFSAPRTLDVAMNIQYQAKLAGVGGEFWINGNRLDNHTKWVWNQNFLKTPIWGSGFPSGGKKSNCATLSTQGEWSDALCDQSTNLAYLCRNGSTWAVSTATGNLSDFSAATAACASLGAGYVFAAPTTYNENVAAKNAMGAHAKVWVNATDAIQENNWVLNAAPAFSTLSWSASAAGQNCVYQANDGKLSSILCTSNDQNPWACTDGYTWRVTAAKGKVDNFAKAHKACLNEYGAAFVFAAPLNGNDAIQLDFARLLAAKSTNQAIGRVWVNMTTGGGATFAAPDGRLFRRNLPFSNWKNAVAGDEPNAGVCAFKGSLVGDNPWETGLCSSTAAHYACTNGSVWKVATARGELVNGSVQIVPVAGRDYWSYERGTSMCKEKFGSSFYFSAPVTASEELALDNAIYNVNAQVKRVWLNTYAVSAITGGDNKWFVNRLKLGIWQKPTFKNYNNSDCTVLHKDGSWTDEACTSNSYPVACFKGTWSVVGNGKWSEGFDLCDNAANSLFAVPRTPDELEALITAMGANQKVWINMTDTALESQWIANRLRFTWWDANEPLDVGSRDCARIKATGANNGKWYAGKCAIEKAPFACRRVTQGTPSSDGSVAEWRITSTEGIWSDGFGACQKEGTGFEFMTPQGFGTTSATADQALLQAVMANKTKDAWLNLSDQDVEGSWRAYQAYSNWGISSLLDETNDCAYLDRNSKGTGTWFADQCKYTASSAKSRGYACTDGYQWKIAAPEATTAMRWSTGYAACDALNTGGQTAWHFAAPTNAMENAKLRLAMELYLNTTTGVTSPTQVWINAHDRISEGDWVINGGVLNFAPIANMALTPKSVPENTASNTLHAQLLDDEEQGIASASWSLDSATGARSGTDFSGQITLSATTKTNGANGSATATASYSTPALLKEDLLLTFKITATDVPPVAATPATSITFVQVRVVGPLLAAWDFNNTSAPHVDVTGHGYDALHSSSNPMPQVQVQGSTTNIGGQAIPNGVMKLEPTSSMIVQGKTANPSKGLDFSANAYTIAYRISVEEAAAGQWRGILQKGDDGLDRQPAQFMFDNSNGLHSTNSTTGSSNRATNIGMEFQQWVNVIYSKRPDGFDVYLDGVLATSYNYTGGETPVANQGSFYVGKVPGAPVGFTGYIDDVQIFNRVLSAAERAQILPALPVGEVQFADASAVVNENSSSYNIKVERARGNQAALTVYVDFDAVNSTASVVKGTVADMTPASHVADFAFTDEASYVAGKGIPVTWAAGEKGVKNVRLTLDSADDAIREGTETARFKLTDLNGADAGSKQNFDLNLLDVTPNPFGNFSVGVKPAHSASLTVPENSGMQEICFKRESGTTGEVTVNYQFATSAIETTDYSFGAGGVIVGNNPNSVTFTDGDGTDKCIRIQPVNHPAAGTPDRSFQVQITGLQATGSNDPLLSAQNSAQLIVQDYAPGVFGFTVPSYSCTQGQECKLAVTRSGTGVAAPAATLNVAVTGSVPSGVAFTYTSTVSWPVIDAANPAGATETQYVTFATTANTAGEDNQNLTVTLTPAAAEQVLPTANSATLEIEDLADPAIVTIARSPATVAEGGAITYTISRSGNAQTAFTFNYEAAIAPTMSYGFSHYFDISGSNAKETGTLAFTNGGSNTLSLVYQSIDTVENNVDFDLKVTLKNPSKDKMVGLGSVSNVGQGVSNTTDADLARVTNTRELINDFYNVSITESGTTKTFSKSVLPTSSTYSTTTTDFSPLRRTLALKITLPAGKQFDPDLAYSYTLLNGDGSPVSWSDGVTTKTVGEFTNGSGEQYYDFAAGNTINASLKVPFVLVDTNFILRLTLTNNGLSAWREDITVDMPFTVQPVYRRLQQNGNECYRARSTSDSLAGCGNQGQWSDLYYTWNPDNFRLISKERVLTNNANRCAALAPRSSGITGSDSSLTTCDAGNNKKFEFYDYGSVMIRVDGEGMCRSGWAGQDLTRQNCSGNDGKWSWLD